MLPLILQSPVSPASGSARGAARHSHGDVNEPAHMPRLAAFAAASSPA
jgi:hypothetical protein